MKASELRIGNFVYVDWVDAGRKVETNFGVHYQNISKPLIVMDTTPTGYGCDLKFVKPIPLTKEWLKKFGFIYDCGWYDFGRISVWKNMDRLVQKLKTNIPIYNQFDCPNYVHQLQNLYFTLTGNELIFKE
jgi:hypothetical protein